MSWGPDSYCVRRIIPSARNGGSHWTGFGDELSGSTLVVPEVGILSVTVV